MKIRGTGWLYAESRGFILRQLEKLGELTVYDRTPEDKVLERIGDTEIVYTNKTPLTRETFYKAPNLRWAGVLATGYNVVDVEAARERGIPVANIPYLWHCCCCPDGFRAASLRFAIMYGNTAKRSREGTEPIIWIGVFGIIPL